MDLQGTCHNFHAFKSPIKRDIQAHTYMWKMLDSTVAFKLKVHITYLCMVTYIWLIHIFHKVPVKERLLDSHVTSVITDAGRLSGITGSALGTSCTSLRITNLRELAAVP